VRVTEIVASRSVKVNTGDYENTDHFLSMRAELDELDTPDQAAQELAAQVEESLAKQLLAHYRARGKKALADLAAVKKHHGLKGVGQ
jgi:hypothetical protein